MNNVVDAAGRTVHRSSKLGPALGFKVKQAKAARLIEQQAAEIERLQRALNGAATENEHLKAAAVEANGAWVDLLAETEAAASEALADLYEIAGIEHASLVLAGTEDATDGDEVES